MLSASRLRWLEPLGQGCAAAAFGVQFFFIDPAASDLQAGYFNQESVRLSRIEQRFDGTYKPSPTNTIARPVLDRIPIDVATQDKQKYRPWLIGLFLVGAAMTIFGKSASIRYATK